MQARVDLEKENKQLKAELKKFKTDSKYRDALKNEEMYRLLANNSLDVIWKLDMKLRFTYVSPSLERLTGYTPEEWIGTKLSKYVSFAEFLKMGRHAIKGFKKKDALPQKIFTTVFNCKDGSKIPVEITGFVLKNEKGIPVGLQGSTHDITHRLKAEEELKRSEERYGLALTAAQEGIWDWNLKEDMIFFSDQWKAQLGYKPNELENKFSSWQNLLHPIDYIRAHRELKKYINKPVGRYKITFRLRHKDGSYRYINNLASSLKDENGKVIRMFGAHTDITDQKYIEQALVLSEEKLKTVISEAEVILFSIDKNGIFTFSEGKGLESLNLMPGEMIGKSAYEYYKDQPEIVENVKDALTGEVVRNVVEIGGLFFDTTYSPQFNINNDVESIIGVTTNITDHIKMRRKLKASNKALEEAKEKAEESDRLKSAFLANMSHEIRTPMNSIIGFSDLLRHCESDKERDEYVDIISSNGEMLLNLLNDILDLSKIDGGQLQIYPDEIEISRMMYELDHLYKEKIKKLEKTEVEIKLAIPSDCEELKVTADRNRLFQVMVNLIDNAIKFTNEGVIIFGYDLNETNIRFFVRDTGIGISENNFKVIFERFGQVRMPFDGQYGGTGLGLSISKKLVELMGGEIFVDSKINEGTVFTFNLPILPSESREIKRIDEVSKILKKNTNEKTILIVEEANSNHKIIEELLAPLNIKVISTECGEEAVEICEENEAVDLVLMDLQLPKMTSLEATHRIKELGKGINVIAQVSLAINESKMHSLENACDDFLTKPIKASALLSTIHKFMH